MNTRTQWPRLLVILVASILLLAFAPSSAMMQGSRFMSGSTGEDGPFEPTESMTIDVPAGRVFNYTRVTIPESVIIRYRSNAPIVILATEDVTINGIIDVSGQPGRNLLSGVQAGGEAGPGGGAGGSGGLGTATAQVSGARGLGPAGGAGGAAFNFGNGGNFPTNLVTLFPLTGGSGGGGGGGTNFGIGFGGGGGGGALLIASSSTIIVNGAILANGGSGIDGTVFTEREPNSSSSQANPITPNAVVVGSVSSSPPADTDFFGFDASAGETITVEYIGRVGEDDIGFRLFDSAGRVIAGSSTRRIQSQVTSAGRVFLEVAAARGFISPSYRASVARGPAGELGGGGSGGAIRLVSNSFAGTGRLQALGGAVGGSAGGNGIIRIETFQRTFTGAIEPVAVVNAPVLLPNVPVLRIASIAGVAVPMNPQGSFSSGVDVTIPPGTVNPIPVVVEGMNIPSGVQVTVRVSGQQEDGSPVSQEVTTTLMGDTMMTTATAQLNFAPGINIVEASGTFTLPPQQAQQLPRFQGERIERVRVQSRLGQGARTVYITASGAEVPAERLFGRAR